MSKRKATRFHCSQCGAGYAKWAGQCEACGAWNTVEETAADEIPLRSKARQGTARPLLDLAGAEAPPPRLVSAIRELDRAMGGGFVRGSAILVGGDPGIGKSTLLLQAAAQLARSGRVIYISGEESADQIRLRAARLGLSQSSVQLGIETSLENILAICLNDAPPALVVIDSVQTLWSSQLDSAPGTVAQLRHCAQLLVQFAKRSNACVLLVAHVTKEGQIAGPRVLEHLVDVVAYFEGDAAHLYRMLRCVKNRFGPADEIGVFEMTGQGLREIENPSALFLSDVASGPGGPGAAVFATIEGTRAMLVEIQALVAPSAFATPRRSVVGWDANRLATIMAVLEARCGLRFGRNDVYLNVAGGMRIAEPAADLAVAVALISSLEGLSTSAGCVCFGEISLSGQVRPVARAAQRLREAEKLGFRRIWAPPGADGHTQNSRLQIETVDSLSSLLSRLGALPDAAHARRRKAAQPDPEHYAQPRPQKFTN